MTEDFELAFRYAEEAARDPTYYLPEDDVPYIEDVVDEIVPDINKLRRVFGVKDLLDLYTAFASLMRYHGFLDPEVYPPVVITLALTNPATLNKVYYDEDDFRDWLRDQGSTRRIVEVAMRDPDFYDWLSYLSDEPEQLENAEEVAEYARTEVEEAFYETFPEAGYKDIDDLNVFNAAYHLAAKKIYEALVRLAERGDPDAHAILAEVRDYVRSFYFSEAIPLEQIDLAIATVYTQPKPTEINLNDPGALEQVEEIMKEQILQWARIVTS
jgi:hypothetical protein